jgi:hypothetical protein
MNPNLVQVGSINSGSTAINVDVSSGLGSATAVKVTLSTAFTLASPMPPGFPIEPGQTGVANATFYVPGATIPEGTTLSVFQAVATALINASAATLA